MTGSDVNAVLLGLVIFLVIACLVVLTDPNASGALARLLRAHSRAQTAGREAYRSEWLRSKAEAE
jgi:hypothetical protein